jgi:predicted outer membrane protein
MSILDSVESWRTASLALAACLLTGYAARVDAQDPHIRVTKERVVVAADSTRQQAVTFSTLEVRLPPFAVGAYANLSDSGIVAHMAASDSIEITIANLAALKATEQRVRDYSTILSADHAAHLTSTARVIENEHIAPVALANDPECARLKDMLAWLDTAPAGTAWDAAFLRFQVAHHQNEIAAINANITNKHGDGLVDHMRGSVLSLAKHRDLARSLATTLGVTLP